MKIIKSSSKIRIIPILLILLLIIVLVKIGAEIYTNTLSYNHQDKVRNIITYLFALPIQTDGQEMRYNSEDELADIFFNKILAPYPAITTSDARKMAAVWHDAGLNILHENGQKTKVSEISTGYDNGIVQFKFDLSFPDLAGNEKVTIEGYAIFDENKVSIKSFYITDESLALIREIAYRTPV